ncbi:MAG TPA: PadR family transcriptional regulator [Phycisphaerales bacterium]|nr:PadR family transcriptional regulator [Phycisphaerales bacterium]
MPPSSRPDLLQGTLDMMILKTLSSGSNHGYGIARRIRQVSDDVLTVEEGSLYPALHRLEKRGYILAEWKRSEANRRAKYYSLTRTGRAQLRTEAAAWTQLASAIDKVMNTRDAASESVA